MPMGPQGSGSNRLLLLWLWRRTNCCRYKKARKVLHGKAISELRGCHSCRIGSHNVTCHPTQAKRTPP